MSEKDKEEIFDKLLICLSDIDEGEKRDKISGFSPSEWQDIWEEAERQEVLPILYHIIKRTNLPIPQNLLAEGERVFLKNALRNSLLLIELQEILRRLNEKGVSTILLKGMHWAVVSENIGLRAMGDIDLLVQASDLGTVDKEWLSLGYEPYPLNPLPGGKVGHLLAYSLKEKGVFLEIHWKLLDTHYPFQIETEELLGRARKIEIEGIPCLTLSPEDLLIHLCLHIVAHIRKGDLTLRWLKDIFRWLEEHGENIDWQNILERAREWKASRPVYFVLRLAVELLKAKIPPQWLSSLKPSDFVEEHLKSAKKLLLSSHISHYNLHPLLMEALFSKDRKNALSRLINKLFPPKEFISNLYHISPPYPCIYLFYPVYWFQRFPRRIKDFLCCLWNSTIGDKSSKEALRRAKLSAKLQDWLMKQ